MKTKIAVLLILCATLATFSADKSSLRGQGGFRFLVGVPQGEFRDHLDDLGFGIDFNFGAMPTQYFAAGGDLGFMIYGSETRREPFSMTIPDVTVEVTRTNNFMFGHIYAQAIGDLEIVKPYIEGRVGFNYLWTETRISDVRGSDENIASSTNFSDLTWSYGGGGGIMIKVWEKTQKRTSKKESRSERVYIDLKAIYTRGGDAEYLKEGSMEIIDGRVVFYPDKSPTDLLAISAGVAVDF
ncbi:MAG TPA: hypothetical protein ENN75_01075 [candidate division Zixibacteria bacterium]|nr:hypothetical protein [candidate division Zixibacteria bacterium]